MDAILLVIGIIILIIGIVIILINVLIISYKDRGQQGYVITAGSPETQAGEIPGPRRHALTSTTVPPISSAQKNMGYLYIGMYIGGGILIALGLALLVYGLLKKTAPSVTIQNIQPAPNVTNITTGGSENIKPIPTTIKVSTPSDITPIIATSSIPGTELSTLTPTT